MRKKGILEEFQKEELELIGKKIKYLRIKAGYSNYEDFAHDADIARAQYGKYENGANLMITTLMKILKHHKMTLADFFNMNLE
ncbi:helix-turn-helix transcriptional regulator [Fluviicola taffensis]|uniref:helix-turn-helix domain-containing protein n=1 Tax=Fluviicola taffensis TaxID=191579 RepID=UPI00313777A7